MTTRRFHSRGWGILKVSRVIVALIYVTLCAAVLAAFLRGGKTYDSVNISWRRWDIIASSSSGHLGMMVWTDTPRAPGSMPTHPQFGWARLPSSRRAADAYKRLGGKPQGCYIVNESYGTWTQLGFVAPDWLVGLAIAFPGLVFGFRRLRSCSSRAQGLCRECGYDLRGSTGQCPECGSPRAE
jgi:hypothetical protein